MTRRRPSSGPVSNQVLPAVVSDLTVNGNLTVGGQVRLARPSEQGGEDIFGYYYLSVNITAGNGAETRIAYNVGGHQRPIRQVVPASVQYIDVSGAFRAPINGVYSVKATCGITRGGGTIGDQLILIRSQGAVGAVRGNYLNPVGNPGNTETLLAAAGHFPLLEGQYVYANYYHAGSSPVNHTILGFSEVTNMTVVRIGNYND